MKYDANLTRRHRSRRQRFSQNADDNFPSGSLRVERVYGDPGTPRAVITDDIKGTLICLKIKLFCS